MGCHNQQQGGLYIEISPAIEGAPRLPEGRGALHGGQNAVDNISKEATWHGYCQ
jgi:hypothetical protein